MFIIICIFVWESFQILNKMTEEYFINNVINEKFVNLSNDAKKNDISKTIAINCKDYSKNKKKIMVYKAEPDESLNTPYYAQYKPLEYDSKRKYYWRTNKLVEEGIRRSMDDDSEIKKVKSLYDKEKDPDKKQILEDELNLFKWRTKSNIKNDKSNSIIQKNNILSLVDLKTNLEREKRDIITDYFPEEIGMSRPWIERHSHIPDYSY